MKYYIILLLAIALIGCKKEQDPKPNSLEQTIEKMQGVRMYKGTYITSHTDSGYNITADTQWLDNYPVLIYPVDDNTIALRSMDSTRPSFNITEGLQLGVIDSTCYECVHFSLTRGDYYYTRSFDVTYNPATDKVTRMYVSFNKAGYDLTRTSQVFELAEQ